jgi:hypothetical protein
MLLYNIGKIGRLGIVSGGEQIQGDTSRRAMLKGAIGVGVGIAAYSAPVVSRVPAYAVHGLSSFTRVSSSTECLWFSPNHDSGRGDWHVDTGGKDDTEYVTTAPFNYIVPMDSGSDVTVTFEGNPNNKDVSAYGWGGGGVSITLADGDCEFIVMSTACNSKCGTNDLADAVSSTWAAGSSKLPITSGPPNGNVGTAAAQAGQEARWQGGQTVYYHTGGIDTVPGSKGPNDRCKANIRFQIRCR